MQIIPARKGPFVVLVPSDSKDGYKGQEDRFCDAVNGRYSGRYRGYVMTKAKADFIQSAIAAGWFAATRVFQAHQDTLKDPAGNWHTYRQAKAILSRQAKEAQAFFLSLTDKELSRRIDLCREQQSRARDQKNNRAFLHLQTTENQLIAARLQKLTRK